MCLSVVLIVFTSETYASSTFDNFRSTKADFSNFSDVNVDYTKNNEPTQLQADAILNLKTRGIVSGFADGNFKPSNKLSRGEMSKFVVNSFYGKDYKNQSCPNFGDNGTNDTFYSFIYTLKCEGVVSGFADGTFKATNEVSRGEALKFVFEAIFKKYPKLQEKLLESGVVDSQEEYDGGNPNTNKQASTIYNPKSGISFFSDIPEKNSPESTFYKYSSYTKYLLSGGGFSGVLDSLINGQSANCKLKNDPSIENNKKFCPNDKITRQEMAFLVFSGMLLTNANIDFKPDTNIPSDKANDFVNNNQLHAFCYAICTFGDFGSRVYAKGITSIDNFYQNILRYYPKNVIKPLSPFTYKIDDFQIGDYITKKKFDLDNPTNKLSSSQSKLYVTESGQSDSVQVHLFTSGFNASGDYLEFESNPRYGDTLTDEERNFILSQSQIDTCNKKPTNEIEFCIGQAVTANFSNLDSNKKTIANKLLKDLVSQFGY